MKPRRSLTGRAPRHERKEGDRDGFIRNLKQETRNKRQETRDKKQETGDKKQETGGRRQETGDRRQETRRDHIQV